eukprot:CAMPEP_0115875724 /NCGR_PEP_ID=MMETSP0287-20121206/25258_1 /TAXON_ID=412157 /ORGANISM="Chrysochromulina rotalis, Strain UIO044" /LENGTH=40 /DNA_ID= /DNA_START= /DNA_END= /DNA_ORIENTATION=
MTAASAPVPGGSIELAATEVGAVLGVLPWKDTLGVARPAV